MKTHLLPVIAELTADMSDDDKMIFWEAVAASLAGAMACAVGLTKATVINDGMRPMMVAVVESRRSKWQH
jgi:hypothetical protein